jgi:hypothetical protein
MLMNFSFYSQDTTSSIVQVNFNVPKDWKKVNDTLFIRRNYFKELNYWVANLSQGHMPWRADPKNIAITCLWNFGIKDGKPVDEFATHLTEIKKNKVFSFTVDSTRYIICVRTKKRTPIAYKLEIRHD